MKRIAIVHYLPLEYYPPITNLLDLMAHIKKWKINVYTTGNNKGRNIYKNNRECRIYRMRLPDPKENFSSRAFFYLTFAIKTLISLIYFKPHAILYYESISAGPVYFYANLVGKRVPLFIHYHEYCSPEWYKNGMRLVKWYHVLERKFLYKKAVWISQTNKDRIRLFLSDNPEVDSAKVRELPNYPPASWASGNPVIKEERSNVTKIVYVGALSLETTYIKKFCEWICEQEREMSFDIFSYNMTNDVRVYLKRLKSKYIRFFEYGVEYCDLPALLSNYDVGVILYKPLIDNFKYNAPNKLFEYRVCGLQVWFPETLLGILPFQKMNPLKIVGIDFTNLREQDMIGYMSSQNLQKDKSANYTAEMGVAPLIEVLKAL